MLELAGMPVQHTRENVRIVRGVLRRRSWSGWGGGRRCARMRVESGRDRGWRRRGK